MRIVMLDAAAGEEVAGVNQRLDDAIVGVALLAIVVHDAGRTTFCRRAEARRVFGVETGVVDGEGDLGRDAARFQFASLRHPGVKVLATVARSGVDEARAGIVGDVIAIEKRDNEIVAKGGERVGAGDAGEFFRSDIADELERDLCLGGGLIGKPRCEDQALARLRAKVVRRRLDLVEAIGEARREGDGAVAGDGPGGRGPDDDEGPESSADPSTTGNFTQIVSLSTSAYSTSARPEPCVPQPTT